MKSIDPTRVVLLVLLAAGSASALTTTRAVAMPAANPSAPPQALRSSQPTPSNIGVIGTGTLGSPRPGAGPSPSKPSGK